MTELSPTVRQSVLFPLSQGASTVEEAVGVAGLAVVETVISMTTPVYPY